MSGDRLLNESMLHLLWLAPALVLLYIYASHMRQKVLRRFADARILPQLGISASARRRRWKTAVVVAATALIVVGLARPAWRFKAKTVRRRGRDVVFVLDVSKSMLAQDLGPNSPSRLDRAKRAIIDCVDVLEGDRVGLIAFAGTAAVKCPLTLDYGFFRMMLEDISVNSISRGGTMIGDALRKAVDDVFDERDREDRDVVLITDGEDHDSFPVEASRAAGEKNIRLIAIGLGDEGEGRPIPIQQEDGRMTFLTYNGTKVMSRLDADTLREMVNATPGGKYLNVAKDTLNLGSVYLDLVASAEKKELESRTIKRREERFQVFLALALALLITDSLMSERTVGKVA